MRLSSKTPNINTTTVTNTKVDINCTTISSISTPTPQPSSKVLPTGPPLSQPQSNLIIRVTITATVTAIMTTSTDISTITTTAIDTATSTAVKGATVIDVITTIGTITTTNTVTDTVIATTITLVKVPTTNGRDEQGSRVAFWAKSTVQRDHHHHHLQDNLDWGFGRKPKHWNPKSIPVTWLPFVWPSLGGLRGNRASKSRKACQKWLLFSAWSCLEEVWGWGQLLPRVVWPQGLSLRKL